MNGTVILIAAIAVTAVVMFIVGTIGNKIVNLIMPDKSDKDQNNGGGRQ